MRINIIVNFKSRTEHADTDLQCVHDAINKMIIEIDTAKYSELKYLMKNKNRYQHPFNSIEFVSTIISSDLIENIDSIETEAIIEEE